ncbi:UNVERIFIED_CONTAM: hypothetical protein Sradi_6224900 [Sesamum radiatum]|uniref:Reverse transcriptase domain-containing protein n=1 Tax=Sesamum radiatum TaxID=300843 RepID=A0AAW2KB25_SESRA
MVLSTLLGLQKDKQVSGTSLGVGNGGADLGLVQVPVRFIARSPAARRYWGRRGQNGSLNMMVVVALYSPGATVESLLTLFAKGWIELVVEGWTTLFPNVVIAHLHEACSDHAALLLTTEDSRVIEEITACLEQKVTEAMNLELLWPFTIEEVKQTLDSMHPLKSPGPDSFVPGRSILDNVLVVYEVNHYLSHKYQGKSGHVSLKLDLSKAYDRVEWLFLERVMVRLGFDSRFVELRMLCVKSVSFSFILNGVPFGHVQSERGLCQGDPLSPYLFLFCAEAFSNMVRKEEAVRAIRGVELTAVLGVTRISKHEKYLGLPSIIGRSKREVFASLKEKVWQRLQGWTSKRLSQAGRGILIQSIILAIPAYVMSCFIIPEAILDEIESMAAIFFWDQDSNRKIHCVAWQMVCKSKKEGGLGFKRFRSQNLALLSTQTWRLASNPQG